MTGGPLQQKNVAIPEISFNKKYAYNLTVIKLTPTRSCITVQVD